MKWFMGFFALIFLFLPLAQAKYYTIPVTAPSLDPQARTHVLVAGYGNHLDTALQYAATAKIHKLRQVYPKDQILFIAVQENEGNSQLLRSFGYKTIQLHDQFLDSSQLMTEISPYSAIASLHVFSHSGVVAGIFLDKYNQDSSFRWEPQDPQSSRLKGHFTDDAYATLNGCNAGHVQAPVLSSIWGIPVAGALASSHFEGLFVDGKYYWAEGKLRNQMQNCISTTCYRLRPDNANYNGYWGVFKQGLPFYKFFCADGIQEEKCLSAMAASVATNVSQLNAGPKMTADQYAAAVREWLCPSGRYSSSMQQNCMNTLAKMDLKNPQRSYSPFLGNSAQCSFKACYEAPECMFPNQRLCPKEMPLARPSTTFVDEYIYYLKAFKYLKKIS